MLLAGGRAGFAGAKAELINVFTADVARFTNLLSNPVSARRVEGIQGLCHVKYWPAEDAVLALLKDRSPDVRREAVIALGRLGGPKSVPALIGLLEDRAWEIRSNAAQALRQITGLGFPATDLVRWRKWWDADAVTNHVLALRTAVINQSKAMSRADAIRALRCFAMPSDEDALIGLLHAPGLTVGERNQIAEALERVGTAKSVPALAGFHADASAWALGRIGGTAAEQALLRFPKSLAVLINLDRLHSTNCGRMIPFLVGQMGLVTYRGQPDDLMNADAQPIQRVGANLIRRSGRAPEFIDQVLLELEYSMAKPPPAPRPPIPTEWRGMLEAMRSELKPGFVREDGVTTSQPLTALSLVADDPALVPRLLPLLRHPAFVSRVYVAMTLGRLHAKEALPALLEIIREGYPFSDSVAIASGKHFDQSQTVRWRGFLCIALGRMGGDEARRALEEFAADPAQPRDIRYSSVVGLSLIGSQESLPVLRKVAANDIIWMVRDEARRTAEEIETLRKEVAASTTDDE